MTLTIFTVTVTEKERVFVELARELICFRDGYLSLINGFVMPREDLQTVLIVSQLICVFRVTFFISFLYFLLVLRVRFL